MRTRVSAAPGSAPPSSVTPLRGLTRSLAFSFNFTLSTPPTLTEMPLRSRYARPSTSSLPVLFRRANRSATSTSERMLTPSTVMAGGRASLCPLTKPTEPTPSSSDPRASSYFFRNLSFASTVSGSTESGSHRWRTRQYLWKLLRLKRLRFVILLLSRKYMFVIQHYVPCLQDKIIEFLLYKYSTYMWNIMHANQHDRNRASKYRSSKCIISHSKLTYMRWQMTEKI